MSVHLAWPRARLGLIGLGLIGLLGAPIANAAAPDADSATAKADVTRESPAAIREADTVKLGDLAESKGALGVYVDKSGDYVVVMPADRGLDFAASDAASVDLPVRVEVSDLNTADVTNISSALEATAEKIPEHSFSFGFDPAMDKMLLRADGPESLFAEVEEAFPGQIEFRKAKFEATSQSNDGEPHYAGAAVSGPVDGHTEVCTSGFGMQITATGVRYMVTAGHCFPDGTSTTMGVVSRSTAVFPDWDYEYIKWTTYAGYVYDTATHARPWSNGTNPGVGSVYCTSGISSGFVCDWTVYKLNQTLCNISGFPFASCQHNLAEFARSNGQPIQLGDSGGPLWYKYSSTAGIRGVISLRSYDAFEGWNSYATQYLTIANHYGATVIVP